VEKGGARDASTLILDFMAMYPIIIAGGTGTRLWPISTKGMPKQVYPLFDKETLLQKTWRRLRRGFSAKNIFLSTSDSIASAVRKQLSQLVADNVITEPVRRGTASALGLALLKLYKRDPKGIFVYINSDNFVSRENEFIRLLQVAERVITQKPDNTLLIGVNPTYPEAGYGYIKMGRPVMHFSHSHKAPTAGPRKRGHGDEIFEVERFVEKPDLTTAKAFLRSWRYLWNPTLIVARADHFLGLYRKHLPETWKVLERIARKMGTAEERSIIQKEFPKIESETVDYGILEKEKKMLVLPGNFGWTDIGHWRAVHEILAKGQYENICRGGKCIQIDSRGNLIYSQTGKLTALAGISNTIVVETENVLLICPKERAQDVKKLVEAMEKKGMAEYL